MNLEGKTVLFAWNVNQRLKSYLETKLRAITNLNLIFPDSIEDEVLLAVAPSVDIMVGWRVKDEIKLAAKKMRLFINPGVGIKHHIEFFKKLNEEKRVLLINGHGNAYFTAQHTVALLLSFMNKIIPHHIWMTEGKWRMGDNEAVSIPLRYRKIGLLGYGHINQLVHQFLQGFNVEFAILRNDWSKPPMDFPTPIQRFNSSELNEFLDWSDILIIAVPETTSTIGMIGANEIMRLGEDGILINVSRGSIVQEADLFTALEKRIIAGAGIDVWYNYSPEANNNKKKYPFSYPFYELDNIVLSPHRAASPFSDLERWDEVIENIKRFCRGETEFLNVVDLDQEY
ncbi:MAG: hypothetical protein EAX86_03260 [Candidatus Heimdallarchaeota archaeon]|nr:hypothetical protein [Candidatus Heimdallarchaeota archaeon]